MAAVTPRPIDPKPKPIDPNPAAAAKRRRQFQQFANRVRQGVRGPGKSPPTGAPLTRMPIPPGGASRGSGDDRTFGPWVNRKGPSIVKGSGPTSGTQRFPGRKSAGHPRITEDDPRWKASTMGNKTGWEKGTWFTGATPQINRNKSAETGKKSANWGEKYGVGVDRKGREIHVYSDGRTVQAHSDAFYKANPDALKPPSKATYRPNDPNPAKGKIMPRTPPPVPGAANRRGLLAQFNKRLKHKPKTRGRHGPPGFRGFKPPPRGGYGGVKPRGDFFPQDPTFKRL